MTTAKANSQNPRPKPTAETPRCNFENSKILFAFQFATYNCLQIFFVATLQININVGHILSALMRFLRVNPRPNPFKNFSTSSLSRLPLPSSSIMLKFRSISSSVGGWPVMVSSSCCRKSLPYSLLSTPELSVSNLAQICSTLLRSFWSSRELLVSCSAA